ncbi:hypothetical protein Patl1_22997 [Pistacia atlantica]
MLIKN